MVTSDPHRTFEFLGLIPGSVKKVWKYLFFSVRPEDPPHLLDLYLDDFKELQASMKRLCFLTLVREGDIL